MRAQHLLLCLFIAAETVSAPVVSRAATDVSIGIAIGPPPPPVVYVPPPRPGYAWAPGYWAWDGYRNVWIEGRWIVARRGYVWITEHREPRGRHWRFVPGRWEREHKHHGHGRHRGYYD